MKKELQKRPDSRKNPGNLPSTIVRASVKASSNALVHWQKLELTKGMPPATIVYAVGAGAFFAFALLLLFHRHWLGGILTLIVGGLFVAFAYHIMRHSPPRR